MCFWLPRVKQQIETSMENNPNSIDIDNYFTKIKIFLNITAFLHRLRSTLET
jgi:hypothetical protein